MKKLDLKGMQDYYSSGERRCKHGEERKPLKNPKIRLHLLQHLAHIHVQQTSTLADTVQKFKLSLQSLKNHIFVKSQQSQYFDESKNSLQKGEAVVQVDYAKN
ncbi:hypothetical protein PR048_018247 [Dryococelus australis]|uniref:Uncharacterized protein n=1 Tax=Dryococelus australis TaxID=614101 RepID=A0ABQ9HBR4_9NEOP|nr:hypothetical protein PR048_018247 [Dryococelus australis]